VLPTRRIQYGALQAPDLRRIGRRLETWFARHQRPLPWRDGYEPYRVWVSEMMLQQTRMEVVLPYFERFLARFPSVAALAATTDDDVTAAWSGLGYYRRARMLRAGAVAVMERFGGVVPSTVEELLTIPGIGRYTAGAIASIAFDARAPIATWPASWRGCSAMTTTRGVAPRRWSRCANRRARSIRH
jgi:A/G-specific adenine glycosylase